METVGAIIVFAAVVAAIVFVRSRSGAQPRPPDADAEPTVEEALGGGTPDVHDDEERGPR